MSRNSAPLRLEDLLTALDEFFRHYNTERTHQGKRCQGRTPIETFLDGKEVLKTKLIAYLPGETCQPGS